MSSYTFHSSRPDSWTSPRPYRDASQRLMAYGPIQPMQQPGTGWSQFMRLFGFN